MIYSSRQLRTATALTFSLVTFFTQYGFSQVTPQQVVLSQKIVAELALKQSSQAKEVDLRYQQFRLPYIQTLSAYDWLLNVETGFEYDKSASILTSSSITSSKYERYKTTATLTKPFTTGTTLGLELSSLSQKSEITGSATPPPGQQTLDSAGLVLEQALLGNFFGVADRGSVNAAEYTYQANEILHANELEDVVLEAIRQFWDSYVAQENLREAISARDRYKKLVDSAKRKTSLGYATPGELSQVLAEFEGREQTVSQAKVQYEAAKENLITLLKLEPRTEIKFSVPEGVPAIPTFAQKKIEDLRVIRSQRLKLNAAEEALNASESKSYPTLNFVGKVYTTGADASASESFSEVTDGNQPKYYAGLKLQYNFGSGIQEEDINSKRLSKDLETARLQRTLLEATDAESQAQRKVKSAHEIAESAARQRVFREKAVTELTKTFNQGRTDISILIEAMNKYYSSGVAYTRAVGDYAIAITELAATRDELIP